MKCGMATLLAFVAKGSVEDFTSKIVDKLLGNLVDGAVKASPFHHLDNGMHPNSRSLGPLRTIPRPPGPPRARQHLTSGRSLSFQVSGYPDQQQSHGQVIPNQDVQPFRIAYEDLKFEYCTIATESCFDTSYVKKVGTIDAPPVVLVHGFGASSSHWRATLEDLVAAGRTVYAIDLLGFGSSPKPQLHYSIDIWAKQLQDFVNEVVVGQDGYSSAVVVGNSIGSLTCVTAAAQNGSSIAGVGLFNCAIGMNPKARPLDDDHAGALHRIFDAAIVQPLLAVNDHVMRSPLVKIIFNKLRTNETIRQVLQSGVYLNKKRVDDELVHMITRPAEDPGALEAFVDILTGDPGPRPEKLVPQIKSSTPIAVWWGPKDPITLLAGAVAQYFKALPNTRQLAEFTLLPDTGHCPFDDRPELASPALIDWLERHWPSKRVAAAKASAQYGSRKMTWA